MKGLALLLAGMGLTGCAQSRLTDLCDIAKAPDTYVGRTITISDTILVASHGYVMLVPNADCSVFNAFDIEQDGTMDRMINEASASAPQGTAAYVMRAIAGVYTLKVTRSPERRVRFTLLGFKGVHLATAEPKLSSIQNDFARHVE